MCYFVFYTCAWDSHAYFLKYVRFVRLDRLGFKTLYFSDLPSKNNYQLFFSVAYRRASSVTMGIWLTILMLLIKDQQRSQTKNPRQFALGFPFGSPCWAWIPQGYLFAYVRICERRSDIMSPLRRRTKWGRIHSHAYFLKYVRFVRLGRLGFKTLYFSDLPSKNNYQLFFSVAYRLS